MQPGPGALLGTCQAGHRMRSVGMRFGFEPSPGQRDGLPANRKLRYSLRGFLKAQMQIPVSLPRLVRSSDKRVLLPQEYRLCEDCDCLPQPP